MKKNTYKVRGQKRAFTLLEVLMVVVIIGLLAAFVAPMLFNTGDKVREDLARAAVTTGLGGALDLYKVHMGEYPPSDAGGLKLLMEAPDDEDARKKWAGPYLKKAADLKDQWDREWIYRAPGEYNKNSYDLSSAGRDKQEGTDDDITNWERT